jgi:hypothetical protein
VVFCDATLKGAHCSCDLAGFSLLGFGEQGQPNDASAGGNPIGDSDVSSMQHEAKFAQRTLELAGEWLVKERTELCEPVDMKSDAGLVAFVELDVPRTDFVPSSTSPQNIASTLSSAIVNRKVDSPLGG